MNTATTTLPQAAIGELRAATGSSPVHLPGDDGYDPTVRAWNTAVILRPAAVLCADRAEHVAAAVRWAARHRIPVGVHATGHGAVPNAGGALLVNTTRLNRVEIDPDAGTATVGAGATIAAAADRVRAIDVVTADGVLRTVDAGHQPDLFWGLRGANGNLGIVTGLTLELFPLETFFGGGIYFDGAHAPAVLHAYRQWVTGHTDHTSSSVALLHLPPDPALPAPLRGRFVTHVRLAHVGTTAEGARLAALFAELRPWVSPGNLPNVLGRTSDPDLVTAAWPADLRDRLLLIQRRWDPDNLLRLGHALRRDL